MSDEKKMRLNTSAIVAAVIFLISTVFASGVAVSRLDTAIESLHRIEVSQVAIRNDFEAFKADVLNRIARLEKRNEVIDSRDSIYTPRGIQR
jgi:hypothetical protein